MNPVWRHRLVGLLLALVLAAGSVVSAVRQRMPSPQDVAAAQFLALGGTVDDLCGSTAAQGIASALDHFCAAPGLALLEPPPGVLLAGVVGAVWGLRAVPPSVPVALRRVGGAGARAPPAVA